MELLIIRTLTDLFPAIITQIILAIYLLNRPLAI
jgi:hypothetical protein